MLQIIILIIIALILIISLCCVTNNSYTNIEYNLTDDDEKTIETYSKMFGDIDKLSGYYVSPINKLSPQLHDKESIMSLKKQIDHNVNLRKLSVL